MLAAAVTGSLEARDGLLSNDKKKVKELVDESKAVSREFGDLVAAMLKWKQKKRPG